MESSLTPSDVTNAADPSNTPKLPNLTMEFEALQSEPPVEKIFIENGGTLATAAARGATDFAVSGASHCTTFRLSERVPTVVRIPIPTDMISVNTDQEFTINMDHRAKLLSSTTRVGASINGSVVDTVAGQGYEHLATIFRSNNNSVLIPLKYANMLSHTAVIAASSPRIVDDNGRRYSIVFTTNDERDMALKAAEQVVGQYANGAWQMRQNSLVYHPSPSLTKCVAKVPVGVNESGYRLVQDIVARQTAFSYTTINSLLENSVKVECEFDEKETERFLNETKYPGMAAAGWGHAVASGLSLVVNSLFCYRADGRTRVGVNGCEVDVSEYWAEDEALMRADDCDFTAMAAVSTVKAINDAPKSVLKTHPYINAVRNVIFPHFSVGVTVLGASSPEASGGGAHGGGSGGESTGCASGDGVEAYETANCAGRPEAMNDAGHIEDAEKTKEMNELKGIHTSDVSGAVAGHAAVLMLNNLDLLKALETGGNASVSGKAVLDADKRVPIAEARFKAIFSEEVVSSMPLEEQKHFASWSTAKQLAHDMSSFAIEGTTPASGILYSSGKAAADKLERVKRDDMAFAKASPSVGRSIKILHVGGQDSNNPHRFYRDFVEFNLGNTSPLWTDPNVRAIGAATTQLVLSKQPNKISNSIDSVGATPRDIAVGSYAAVPLVTTNHETASLLDYANEQTLLDVMPPRPPNIELSPHASTGLSQSLQALSKLDDHLQSSGDAADNDGHWVGYLLSFSTLCNNPMAVRHFCERLASVSNKGLVDSLDVKGLAHTTQGAEAGRMVVISTLVAGV